MFVSGYVLKHKATGEYVVGKKSGKMIHNSNAVSAMHAAKMARFIELITDLGINLADIGNEYEVVKIDFMPVETKIDDTKSVIMSFLFSKCAREGLLPQKFLSLEKKGYVAAMKVMVADQKKLRSQLTNQLGYILEGQDNLHVEGRWVFCKSNDVVMASALTGLVRQTVDLDEFAKDFNQKLESECQRLLESKQSELESN